MYLSDINLAELGQYLQILLWISLPMVIVVLVIAIFLHYRNQRRQQQEADQSYEAHPPAPQGNILLAGYPEEAPMEERGNAYRGLLWMKDKYESYREQTDRKCEKLKEDLARSERKYLDLLAERSEAPVNSILSKLDPAALQTNTPQVDPASAQTNSSIEAITEEPGLSDSGNTQPTAAASLDDPQISTPDPELVSLQQLIAEKDRQISFLQNELDQRIKNYHELEYEIREERARAEESETQYSQTQLELEASQSRITALNEQLVQETGKVIDLTGKLENNIRLLLHIHQELDRSLLKERPGSSRDKALPSDENPSDESASPSIGNPLSSASEATTGLNGTSGPQAASPTPHEDTKIVAWIESEEVEILETSPIGEVKSGFGNKE